MSPLPASVLLVTADPLLERSVHDGLGSRGYRVARAANHGEARLHLQKGSRPGEAWSAVVLDLAIEDGKGSNLMRWAVENLGATRPPFVLLGPAGAEVSGVIAQLEDFYAQIQPSISQMAMDIVRLVEEILSSRRIDLPDLLSRDNPLINEDGAFNRKVEGLGTVIRMLAMLAVAQETGCLRRTFADEVGEIRLVRGGLVASNSPDSIDLLGRMAVQEGLINERQLQALLDEASPLPLGVRMVRLGLVSPQAIRTLIRMQVRKRALSLLKRAGGQVEWTPEPLPVSDPLRVNVPVIPVVWQASRFLPPWVPGALYARPLAGRSVALIVPELPLREPHRRFLMAMDGRSTVASAASRADLADLDALHLCSRLEAVGALADPDGVMLAQPKDRPERNPPAPAHRDVEATLARYVRDHAWDEVIVGCERLLESGIASPRVYCWLGLARHRKGIAPEKCVAMLHKALYLDPSYVLAHKVLARVLDGRGYPEATEVHRRIVALVEAEIKRPIQDDGD